MSNPVKPLNSTNSIDHRLSVAPMLDSADNFIASLYLFVFVVYCFLFGDAFGDELGF